MVVLNREGRNPVVVSRSVYKGVERLDVRRHYYNAAGELCPTQKGVSLPLETGLAAEALEALRTVNGEERVLGASDSYPVVVKRKEFKGMELLDIRRHYVDRGSGELRPTRKGISLSTESGLDQEVIAAMAELLAGGAA